MRPALDFTFGLGGNAQPYQVSGWSFPEDGYTWAVGTESVLRAPLTPAQGDLLLDMTLRPFMIPPYRSSQRVGLRINGTLVGEERVQDDSALGFRIPAALVAGRPDIEITLICPDALSPKDAAFGEDPRKLSVRLRDLLLIWADPEPAQAPIRLPPLPIGPDPKAPQTTELIRGFTGHAPDDLMLQFESLGANCEFGLVQRALGAEPLGLLRFVGIDVQNLLSGLDFGFDGIDDPAHTRIYTDGGEDAGYVSVNDRYAVHRHSYQPASAMDEATFLQKELRKIAREREAFLEILESGQKLFVYQRQEGMAPAHVMPILNMLRSHGANALLFVTLNHTAPAGSVDLLGPDLYRGNIDRLAPIGNAVDSNIPAWISICANAYRLWRQTGHGGGGA
jgi:hypothetical protein